jgi:two-component system, NtrC family, nitrogen regulation sensor histidine kinase NtrY
LKDTATKRRFGRRLQRSLMALRTTGSRRLALYFAYLVALGLTGFIIWMIIAAPGTGPLGPSSGVLFALVCINMLLLCGLAYFALRRVYNIWRSREAGAGARLHVRFVTLFSLSAVIPALLLALFFGVMVNRGVETWFSERVQTSVENGAKIADTYFKDQVNVTRDVMGKLVGDLESDQARSVFPDRLTFAMSLKNVLSLRGGLSAVYVIDKTGQVLARAELPGAPAYLAPPQATLDNVSERDLAVFGEGPEPDSIRSLYALEGYDAAYLYGVQLLPNGTYARLRTVERAINELRDAAKNSARVQSVFALAYAETVMLVRSPLSGWARPLPIPSPHP